MRDAHPPLRTVRESPVWINSPLPRTIRPRFMVHTLDPQRDVASLRVAIARSTYHSWATGKMLEGAVDRWRRLGGAEESLVVATAAGTWELPAIARAFAETGRFDAVVALGVVIRGETDHFEYICQGVTAALAELTLRTGVPVGFGVLTCDNAEQVKARTGGDAGNKGAEAMTAAVETALMIRAVNALRPGES